MHPDKHSTDGCGKEAANAFKDLQSKKSCTETNENTVPNEAIVAKNTVPQTNAPLSLTTNAVVAPTNAVPQTNAPLALTTNAVPQTNAPTTNVVVVPTNAVPQTNALTTNTTVVAPATNTTAIVVSK